MDNNENAIRDVEDLNTSAQDTIFHYDGKRVEFIVTSDELNLLEKSGNHTWKEICFAAIGITLSLALNILMEYAKPDFSYTFTKSIFINSVVTAIGFTATVISAVCWYNSNNNFRGLVKKIRNKPQFKLPSKNNKHDKPRSPKIS